MKLVFKIALFSLLSLPLTQCKTNNLDDSATLASSSKLMNVLKKAKCSFQNDAFNEKDVFRCAKILFEQKITPDDLKALLASDTTESKIVKYLEQAMKEMVSIIHTNYPDKATRINQLFRDYREGKQNSHIKSTSYYLKDLFNRTSFYKLKFYLVAAMEGSQQIAVAQGQMDEKDKLTRDQSMAKADAIIDIVEMEGCTRGLQLKFIGKLDILRSSGCKGRKYTPWSQINSNRLNFGLNNLKFTPNQVVALLKNGPVVNSNTVANYDSRKVIMEGHGKMPSVMIQNGITQPMLQRSKYPYTWMWMWGFYDDVVGREFSSYLQSKRLKKDIHLYIDENVAKKDGHVNTRSVLFKSDPNILNEIFKYPLVNGKKYTGAYKGFGMHKKALIVDGKFLIVGGRNFGVDYSRYWRDTDVLVAGQSALIASRIFEMEHNNKNPNTPRTFDPSQVQMDPATNLNVQMYNKIRSAEVNNKTFYNQINQRGKDSVSIVTNNPIVSEKKQTIDKILSLYIDLINRAKPGSTVYIENAYIILTAPLKAAIKNAVKKGVKFNISTNSPLSSDENIVSMPIMLSVREILEIPHQEGQIKINLRRARYKTPVEGMEKAEKNLTTSNLSSSLATVGDLQSGNTRPSTLHSKYMFVETADNRFISVISTYNLHPRSLRYEEEMAVVVESPNRNTGLWKQLYQWFHEEDALAINSMDIMHTTTVTRPEEIKFIEPVSYKDPRSKPKNGTPADGKFIMVNSGVAAAMIMGYDQL